MAWMTATALNYRDFLRQLRHFVTGRATVGAVTQTGTGNGTLDSIDPVVGAVSQTWTLTCTAGGPTATFSVTGSISGAMAAATVGTAYGNAQIAFLISDGSVDFAVGAQFVFAVTASTMPSGERWVQDRWVEASTTQELLMHGPGLAGVDAIYGGLRSYEDLSVPYHAIDIMGHSGYVAGNDFYSQPGRIPAGEFYPCVTLANTSMTFWLVANGRRIVFAIKHGTIFQAGYLGFPLPYGTPGQYPYPIFVGGSMTGQFEGRSAAMVGAEHRHFVDPGYGYANPAYYPTACRLRAPDGRWVSFSNRYYDNTDLFNPSANTGSVFPYNWSLLATHKIREAIDGVTYPLTDIVLMESISGVNNIWGALDGCFHVSGFNNAAENIVQVGGVDHLVIQNVYRVGIGDYWALRLQ